MIPKESCIGNSIYLCLCLKNEAQKCGTCLSRVRARARVGVRVRVRVRVRARVGVRVRVRASKVMVFTICNKQFPCMQFPYKQFPYRIPRRLYVYRRLQRTVSL